MTYTICLVGSTVVALLVTPLVIWLARATGIVDVPNVRKVHSRPMPRAGGLAAFLSMTAIGLPSLILLSRGHTFGGYSAQLTAMWIAGTFLLVVGLIDDIFDISSQLKLIALIAAAATFCAAGGTIQAVHLRGHLPIDLGLLAWPVTILWIIGIVVSVNFIDGLDGLAGGLSAIAALVIAIVAAMHGETALAAVALTVVGSLLGFLFYNWHPAKIFLGDCGTMFIGFMIACLAVIASTRVGTVAGIMLPALALAVPIVDAALTVIRRGVLHRRSLFAAERGHIHHRLLDIGLCHLHVVELLLLLSIATTSVGFVAMLLARGWAKFGVWILVAPMLGVVFRMAGSVRVRETFSAIRRNRAIGRNSRAARVVFEDTQLRFRAVQTFEQWWEEVCRAADGFGLWKLNLKLTNRDGTTRLLQWERNRRGPTDPYVPAECDFSENLLRAELPVADRRAGHAAALRVELVASESLEEAGRRLSLFTRLIDEYNLLKALGFHAGAPARSVAAMAPADRDADSPPLPLLPPTVRIAVVHDFLYTYAGAERVLEQILLLCPDADVFSLFDFLPANQRQFIQNKKVQTSFLQKMPWAARAHRMYLPLMPLAIEQLDLSSYDVVISSSYVAAKGVLTGPNQLHVCYCHSPVRFAWDLQSQYLGVNSGFFHGLRSTVARLIFHYIRAWDTRTANGVDAFATNSDFVARRIRKIYRRNAKTIYPPVDVSRFTPAEGRKKYYMTASRLVPYKRIDLIVEAFSKTPERELIVIGEGPEFGRIAAKAGPNVRMLGYQPFERLRYYMQHARAFVFAAEEDFGIIPVEAQACGTPVIAFGAGGVRETVVEGKTGVFFQMQTVESLLAAVESFENCNWSHDEIRDNAQRFGPRVFREEFARFVRHEYAALKNRSELGIADGPLVDQEAAASALLAFATGRSRKPPSELGMAGMLDASGKPGIPGFLESAAPSRVS